VRLESQQTSSEWFPWARMGIEELPEMVAEVGFDVREHWHAGRRWFATLQRR
jgi:hypothetical protein